MMMNTSGARSLSDMWRVFQDGAIPPGAPPIQVECMSDAFYGGAWAVMLLLNRATRHHGTQGAKDMLLRLGDEIEAHYLAACGASRMTGQEADKLIALLERTGAGLNYDERRFIRMLLTGNAEPPDVKQ